jgi:RimJ/RimL family protein N-acetyltransferase
MASIATTNDVPELDHVTFEWLESLSERDAENMVALMNEVSVNETTLGFFERIDAEFGRKIMAGTAAELSSRAIRLLVARDLKHRIVGMLTLARYTLPARSHIVEMKRCVVDPKYRGRFILQGWSHALDMVSRMGCDMIVLDVRSDGRAERLWRRLGFKEYGRLDDYARVRGRIITGYFLGAYISDLLSHRDHRGTSLHRAHAAEVGQDQE